MKRYYLVLILIGTRLTPLYAMDECKAPGDREMAISDVYDIKSGPPNLSAKVIATVYAPSQPQNRKGTPPKGTRKRTATPREIRAKIEAFNKEFKAKKEAEQQKIASK